MYFGDLNIYQDLVNMEMVHGTHYLIIKLKFMISNMPGSKTFVAAVQIGFGSYHGYLLEPQPAFHTASQGF
jgi:hypothetical protein